jgi:hypothetical protein
VQVKIKRSAVAMTRLLTGVALRNDWLLRRLFRFAARGLPLAKLGEVRRPQRAPRTALQDEPELLRSYGSTAT